MKGAECLLADRPDRFVAGEALLDQRGDRAFVEHQFETMGFLKAGREGVDLALEHVALPRRILAEQQQQGLAGLGHGGGVNAERFDAGRRQLELEIAKHALEHGHQAARPGVLLVRLAGDLAHGLGEDLEVDAVSRKVRPVLGEDAALAGEQNALQIVGGEGLAGDAHRQAADEFGLHAIVNDVPRLRQLQVIALLLERGGGGAGGARGETDRARLQAALDRGGQPVEGAADDEQNVPRVERARPGFAGALEIHHRLHLCGEVGLACEIDVGFLHQLEEIDLHSAPAYVPTRRASGGRRGGCDLVDLIDVDDAVLGEFGVAVRRLDQVAHQVLDIASDVARLGEFRRVRFYKWHADQTGDAPHQVGFSYPGRPQQQNILFGVVGFTQLRTFQAGAHMIVVVANRHR